LIPSVLWVHSATTKLAADSPVVTVSGTVNARFPGRRQVGGRTFGQRPKAADVDGSVEVHKRCGAGCEEYRDRPDDPARRDQQRHRDDDSDAGLGA
jgi:hypothetical protein